MKYGITIFQRPALRNTKGESDAILFKLKALNFFFAKNSKFNVSFQHAIEIR